MVREDGESFKVAEVAQHRLFVLLIIAFGIFEWARELKQSRYPAGFTFPLVRWAVPIADGLHSLGNIKEEFGGGEPYDACDSRFWRGGRVG